MTDRTRLGILGLGSVAATRVQCFADIDSTEIVLAWSRSASTRNAFATSAGIPVVDAWEQVCTSPEVDGVVICTPNAHHYDMARLALSEGKHAFVETPMSLRYTEARELAETAAAGRLVLQHAVTSRYHPDHAAHVDQLRRVGRLFFAIDERTSDYGTHRPWYDDPDLSGGARSFLPYYMVDWLEAFGEVSRVDRLFIQGDEEQALEYRQTSVYPSECQAFEDAIRGRRDPGPELERDLRALELVDEALG